MLDCLELCCGKPEKCDSVCLKNPHFVDRVREVGGFEFDNVPRSRRLAYPNLPPVVPLIYHNSGRREKFDKDFIALSLYQVVARISGKSRINDRADLCDYFGIQHDAKILLTGTHKDAPLERWWGFGDNRQSILKELKALKVDIVTTPNFSLFTDRPRWDDMHSMKRIALVWQEFLNVGIPAALHVNARTDHDWSRWTSFISDRDEVDHLCFEFGTGGGFPTRIQWHIDHLRRMGDTVKRPLTLIVRGGTDALSELKRSFHQICVIDTSAFVKTIKRQQATIEQSGALRWKSVPTEKGSPLDGMFRHNFSAMERHLGAAIQGR
ncbi:MAG: DUF4417 domain-containing protein [Deltaproteobacteria bacterium]|nr:DUF4417 domain-containing protein [Deltaproteobacteria bacterium]